MVVVKLCVKKSQQRQLKNHEFRALNISLSFSISMLINTICNTAAANMQQGHL